MSRLSDLAHSLALAVERPLDEVKGRLRERFGRADPLEIAAYRAYGTGEAATLWGRVLEDEGIDSPEVDLGEEPSAWQTFRRMVLRLESDEVPGARVRAHWGDCEAEAVSDEEGYFSIDLEPPGDLDRSVLWHRVGLELLSPRPEDQAPVTATAEVLVPPPDASFGVISDVDDTIVETNATDTLRMLRTVLLTSAKQRSAFPGVAAFYRALHRGADGGLHNPVFYVSSSPWNLYDVLEEFLKVQELPLGPLLLRDLGVDREKFVESSHDEHKLGRIERVLATYPHLPFVLVGDSGQRDTEIYRRVIEDFPGRILAAYLRDVSPERADAVRGIAEEVAASGVPMLVAEDTVAAAEHAAEHGWIDPRTLPGIRGERAEDERREPA